MIDTNTNLCRYCEQPIEKHTDGGPSLPKEVRCAGLKTGFSLMTQTDFVLALREHCVTILQCDLCGEVIKSPNNRKDTALDAYRLGWRSARDKIYCSLCKDNQR